MPLQITIQESGMIWEAKTIRGAVSAIIGDEYLSAKDVDAEWELRLAAAKKLAAQAKKNGCKVEIYDCRKGILGDDKEASEDLSNKIRIRVENDRVFLLSLVKAGIIKIAERKDTYFLRYHQKWGVLENSGGALQCCSNCLHRIYDKNIVCPVYNTEKEQNDGTDCNSYTIYPGSYEDEYQGGTYIDILNDNTVDELIEKVGQLWMVKDAQVKASE